MTSIQDEIVQGMLKAAQIAAGNAYAPYSEFQVGASVLTPTGEIFAGCNVENAAYGLTICAERNAIFQAVANGHRRIDAVVIFTPTDRTWSPCGSCRQVLREFGENVAVYSFAINSPPFVSNLTDLLPNSFGPTDISLTVNQFGYGGPK